MAIVLIALAITSYGYAVRAFTDPTAAYCEDPCND